MQKKKQIYDNYSREKDFMNNHFKWFNAWKLQSTVSFEEKRTIRSIILPSDL